MKYITYSDARYLDISIQLDTLPKLSVYTKAFKRNVRIDLNFIKRVE